VVIRNCENEVTVLYTFSTTVPYIASLKCITKVSLCFQVDESTFSQFSFDNTSASVLTGEGVDGAIAAHHHHPAAAAGAAASVHSSNSLPLQAD
jgi:hypothetical protein